MIPIKQTILHDPANGKIGNCLSAVLASILHLPIEDVPNFQDPLNWLRDLNNWLRPHGLGYINYEDYDLWTDHQGITGSYHVISGNTNRSADVSHACVGLDSYVVFDPHPSDDGLISKNYYGVFVALRPWEVAQLNSMTVEKANAVLNKSDKLFDFYKDNDQECVCLGDSCNSSSYTLQELKAMICLMEENEKQASRNVTAQEGNVLVRAAKAASKFIASGKFKEPFPQDMQTMLQVATIIDHAPTTNQVEKLREVFRKEQ